MQADYYGYDYPTFEVKVNPKLVLTSFYFLSNENLFT